MRIEYRTYPAQRKAAINDRQHTKRYGERVRLPVGCHGNGWEWFSFVDVLEFGYESLLSDEELHRAKLQKAMVDALLFGLPQAEATHFRGLSGTGLEVKVAKPTAYFRKIKK